jgi:hypothetical protein
MLDPLEYANQLEKHGLSRPLAELIARGSLSRPPDVATKEDIAGLKAEIAGLKTDIANLKVDLIKWMVSLLAGLFIAQAALFWGMLQFTRP